MKTKTICLFCGRSHKKKPKLCEAKGIVLKAWAKALPKRDFWKVMRVIETKEGSAIFEMEAKKLMESL